MARPNGVTTTYSYDNARWLTDLKNTTTAQSLSEFAYTLDKVGNRTQAVETVLQPNSTTSTLTITCIYDPLYRLKEADYSDGRYFHYTYDAVGNRLTQTVCLVLPCVTPVTTTYIV